MLALAVVLAYVVVRACSPDSADSDPSASTSQLQGGDGPTAAASGGPSAEDGDGGESPAEGPAASTTSAEEPDDGTTTQASGGGGGVRPGYCLDENVRLDVRPSKRQYAPGEDLDFTLLFVNVGDAPCRLDVGSAGWSVEIMTGQTLVWSSEHCVTDQASEPQTLDRLTPVEVGLRWDRLRSDPECPTGERPPAAPGTYTVTATAGEVVSPQAVFVLN